MGEPRRADPLLDHRPASRRGRRLVGERSGSRVARAVKWLGWDDAMRRAQLQGVVCNNHFLILPTVRVQAAGLAPVGIVCVLPARAMSKFFVIAAAQPGCPPTGASIFSPRRVECGCELIRFFTGLTARPAVYLTVSSSGRLRNEQQRAEAEPSDGNIPRFATVFRLGTRRDIGPTGRAALQLGRSPWRSAVVRGTPRACRRSTLIPVSGPESRYVTFQIVPTEWSGGRLPDGL